MSVSRIRWSPDEAMIHEQLRAGTKDRQNRAYSKISGVFMPENDAGERDTAKGKTYTETYTVSHLENITLLFVYI
jgi:hypothetical protein